MHVAPLRAVLALRCAGVLRRGAARSWRGRHRQHPRPQVTRALPGLEDGFLISFLGALRGLQG